MCYWYQDYSLIVIVGILLTVNKYVAISCYTTKILLIIVAVLLIIVHNPAVDRSKMHPVLIVSYNCCSMFMIQSVYVLLCIIKHYNLQ